MGSGVVAVTGASGFIGSHLCPALARAGYDVRALTRRPAAYRGVGTPFPGDVLEPATLLPALTGAGSAYYLVHSLASGDFETRDALAARNFARAAASAGVEHVVYLGGLGVEGDRLSRHLRSRREVERILRSTGVPVTVLRCAVVVGAGGISWEITRQLVDHLPAMITPVWTRTRTQPIALEDVVRYLVGVLDRPAARGRTFEIGGADVLRYADMLKQAAAIRGKRVPMLGVPLLSPRLSSAWLALVTDVDLRTARNLVDSMRNEVIVRDRSIEELFPEPPLGYAEAVRRALAHPAPSA